MRAIYFLKFDSDFHCVQHAAVDRSGAKLELWDGAPDPDGPILLKWLSRDDPPDFVYSVSNNLYISQRVRSAWALASCENYSVVPLHLITGRRAPLREDYWWVNLKRAWHIMDEQRSRCKKSGPAFLWVNPFVVDWARVPQADVFLCREVYSPVFSGRCAGIAQEQEFTGATFVEVDGGRWP